MTKNNKVVAINKETGSKYVKCVCKGTSCRVSTKGAKSSWVVDKKTVQLVK